MRDFAKWIAVYLRTSIEDYDKAHRLLDQSLSIVNQRALIHVRAESCSGLTLRLSMSCTTIEQLQRMYEAIDRVTVFEERLDVRWKFDDLFADEQGAEKRASCAEDINAAPTSYQMIPWQSPA